ncbi:hypothetical protein BDV37DRAFT_277353 [Aspergillus pseudonomiae]|uniref:BTB domain-containing protein n=1 Tax=Aspergillus pseudonomiae TaxID=1506151 RepID=A0A5N7CTC3_9EURO|nr:uncharacterized protein BDV37DRAFT_277353 [Aspergillus pseudonomiae]KAE8396833.1 hypothetical protein BDV37DRAFT_277353 [Aspergillus pseudonomiae]
MNETTLVVDSEGEVIIILICPSYPFAPWSEGKTEDELTKKYKKKRKQQITNPAPPDTGEASDDPPGTRRHAEPTAESAAVGTQFDGTYTIPSSGDEIEHGHVEDSEAAKQASDGEEHKDEDCFRIQVSAKHLILSSPVFKKTLTGGWQESFLLLKKGSVEITVFGWDLEAFIILMDIFHCQPQNLPRQVSLELLAKIGILADYYECQALVRYFVDRWINTLKEKFPETYSRDSMLWLWFEKSTAMAISQSSGLITSLGLPIPGKAINYINSRREKAILAILSSLNSHRDAFLDGSRGCSFDCSSTLFGALTKHMHSNALLSLQTEPHFPGLSYHGLEGTVCSFKSPRLCCYNWGYAEYSRYSGYHPTPKGRDSSSRSLLINLPGDITKGLSFFDLSSP